MDPLSRTLPAANNHEHKVVDSTSINGDYSQLRTDLSHLQRYVPSTLGILFGVFSALIILTTILASKMVKESRRSNTIFAF